MEENKIPTYREFLLNRFVERKGLDIEIVAIEFAKMHVKKALEAAVQEYRCNPIDMDSAIENSYPLTNIK